MLFCICLVFQSRRLRSFRGKLVYFILICKKVVLKLFLTGFLEIYLRNDRLLLPDEKSILVDYTFLLLEFKLFYSFYIISSEIWELHRERFSYPEARRFKYRMDAFKLDARPFWHRSALLPWIGLCYSLFFLTASSFENWQMYVYLWKILVCRTRSWCCRVQEGYIRVINETRTKISREQNEHFVFIIFLLDKNRV